MEFSAFVNETFHKLAQQGRQSLAQRKADSYAIGSMGCAYRDDRGGHCAIGFWLDDRVFNSWLNTKSISTVLGFLPDWMLAFGIRKLASMQMVHDHSRHWTSPDALWAAMRLFASEHAVQLDPSIKVEIWANWKNQPPGNLKAIDTYKPGYKTKYVQFNEYLMQPVVDHGPKPIPYPEAVHSFAGYGYAGVKISSKSLVDHTSW